jgi:diguanylate cyclase (GGDEF)-like protein/PAS domain S-box-containing protein
LGENLHGVSRALNALAHCSSVLVRAGSEENLFAEICQVMVEVANYRMAWVGIADRDAAKSVRPVAQFGGDADYLVDANVTWGEGERGQGPTGIAIRTGDTQAVQNVMVDLRTRPWHADDQVRGFASSVALPLKDEHGTFGALTLYAADADAFDSVELRWLDQLASEINYAIAVLRKNREHEAIERDLRRLHIAMDMSIDSIYLTDIENMQFVYVNNIACNRLGYSRAQLLQMGPHDVLGVDREQMRRELDAVVAAGEQGVRIERQFVREDNSEGWTEIHRRALFVDGRWLVVTSGREISERKASDRKILRLNRVHKVLSGINTLIVRVRDREALFRGACKIAVEAGQFRMAWIGIVNRETQNIDPVAWAGEESGFLSLPRPTVDTARTMRVGLSAQAIASGRHVLCNDVESDTEVMAYPREAFERGYRSAIALPLFVDGRAAGVFHLYSGEANFIDEQEMALLDELAGDITYALEHIGKTEQLEYLAFFDELTGLANARLFRDRIGQFVSAAGHEAKQIAVVMLNIERFKTINDTLGRGAGDELLKQIAERARCAIADSNWLARIGGDHFALIFPEMLGADDAARHALLKYREIFAPPFDVGGTELRVAARLGISMFPNDGADADSLMRNAESALKNARSSAERYVFYAQQMTERVAERLSLENKLRRALENEEFVLHYQPKVDLVTNAITGVEALIRWNDPLTGLVPPAHFIPLLEETGLILEVGNWALTQAVRDHGHWLSLNLAVPRVAVNVSPLQLRQRDFVDTVWRALALGAIPTGIDLEITESLLMEDVDSNIAKLGAIRDLGLTIYIDDFGTGYSSLGYLAMLPVQSLKIDRSFVITMLEDPNTMSLVSTIISLAHSLRLKVVAEGVDKEEQAKILRLLRCEEMQGFLFSKPVTRDEMTSLLQRTV